MKAYTLAEENVWDHTVILLTDAEMRKDCKKYMNCFYFFKYLRDKTSYLMDQTVSSSKAATAKIEG